MALLDRLQSGFSFSLEDISSQFSGLSPSAPTIDTNALTGASGPLTQMDLGPITSALSSVSGRGLEALEGFGDVTGLITPLMGALDQIESFNSSEPATLLTRLQEQLTTGNTDSYGIGVITSAFQQATSIGSDSTIDLAVQLISTLSNGALDLSGSISPLIGKGDAAARLVSAVGGLMAIWSQVERMQQTAEQMTGLLSKEEAQRAREQLAGWVDNTELTSRISAVDAEDALAVEELSTVIGEYVETLRSSQMLLQRGLGFGEAALAHSGFHEAIAKISEAGDILRAHQVSQPIRDLSIAIQSWVNERLPSNWPEIETPVDQLIQKLGELLSDLIDTVNDIDVDTLTAPVSGAVGKATGVIRDINRAIETVSGAVRAAMQVVRDAIGALNLQEVAETVRRIIRPVAEVIERFDEILSDSLGIIENAMTTATEKIAEAKEQVLEYAATVKGAFDTVSGELNTALADLPDVIAAMQNGIDEVVDALRRIRLDPYFDTAIDIMDTTATVVEAVPLDILPDDVEADLKEAVAPIKAIDFDNDVRRVLVDKLDEVLDKFDTEILAEIDTLYHGIIQFLQENNPRPAIEDLEATVFDEMLERLNQINPDEILRPVTEILDEVKDLVNAVDLRALALDEVDGVFDRILEYYDQLDPAALLQPVTEGIDSARDTIKDVTKIEEWADYLDTILEKLREILDKIDLSAFIDKMESQYDTLLHALRSSGSSTSSTIGSIVSALVGGSVRTSAFDEVLKWIKGEDGSARVIDALDGITTQLSQINETVEGLGFEDVIAQVTSWHRTLASAIEAKSGTLLHQQVSALVQANNPQTLFAPILAYSPRYEEALSAQLAELQTLATSGFSEITTMEQSLRDGLRPLIVIPQRFSDLMRRFGLSLDDKSPLEIVAEIASLVRPADLFEPLIPLIEAIKAKLIELVEEGLIAPIKEGITELENLIDNISIDVIVEELQAIHRALRDEISALRPSVLLEEPLSAFEELQQTITEYDPLAPVREVITTFKESVEELAAPTSPVRPSVMLDSLLTTYENILSLVGELNIRDILRPILDELEGIVDQLDEGLSESGEAFTKLQEALP